MATIKITEGSDYSDYLQWAQGACRFIPATITAGAPVLITATNHGLPDGWGHVYVLRSDDFDASTPVTVNVVDINTLSVPCVDGGSFQSGAAMLKVHDPVDLAGYSARMQIRATVESTDVLIELVTGAASGEPAITIDNTTKRITRTIPNAHTTALTWSKAVFDLEMVGSGGEVQRIDSGTVSVSKEVTR